MYDIPLALPSLPAHAHHRKACPAEKGGERAKKYAEIHSDCTRNTQESAEENAQRMMNYGHCAKSNDNMEIMQKIYEEKYKMTWKNVKQM